VFFVVAILALAAWMILFDWRSRQAAAPAAPQPAEAAGLSTVQQRKQRWALQRERLWVAAVGVCSFVFILLVTAEYLYAKNQTALSQAIPLQATDGTVRIPVDSVSDGMLHRFLYQGPEGAARFIVLRAGDRLATAIDACAICGPSGYYQNGPNIFCKNCSAAIYSPTIGLTGGCNPIPLSSRVEGDMLLIQVADLAVASPLFPPSE
jgi:uncharacterized membrane protein